MLKKGAVALKYGRQGKPHPAMFRLSEDETTITWEDGRGGLAGSFSNLAGKVAGKKRSVKLQDVAELLIGAESNVFLRPVDGDDTSDVSLCLSMLIDSPVLAPASDARNEKDSLDVRCTDELSFAKWVAALHALLAAATKFTTDGAIIERRGRVIARSAPKLHEEMVRREAEIEAELRAQAEKEVERWMAEMAKREATAAAESGQPDEGGAHGTEHPTDPILALAARDEADWKVGDMKAVLKAGEVSLDGVTEKGEVRRRTRELIATVPAAADAKEATDPLRSQQAEAEAEAATVAAAAAVEAAAAKVAAEEAEVAHEAISAREAAAKRAADAKLEEELMLAARRRHQSTGTVVSIATEFDPKMEALLRRRQSQAETDGIVIETSSSNTPRLPGRSAQQQFEEKKAQRKADEEARRAAEAAEAAKSAWAATQLQKVARAKAARVRCVSVREEATMAAAADATRRAQEQAEAAAAEAEAARRRHHSTGEKIDIWTEKDERMFALLEKQKASSARVHNDADTDAAVADGSDGVRSLSKRSSYSSMSLEAMEAMAREWIESELEEQLPPADDLRAALCDGVALCRLASRLSPGATPTPSSSPLPFKKMENIAAYLKASAALGVAPFEQFQTVDLFEGKGMRAVFINLLALKRVVGERRLA